MTVRAAIYCRISSDPEGRQVGVVTQERDCRRLAAARGWDVVSVFVDNDRSAWKRNRKRPGWDDLMDGLVTKSFDAVIVFHGDRLMRQPRDLEDLLDVADRGVQLASPGGQRDLSDPDDRFILRIEVAHACRSSDDTSRRVKRAHLRLAEEGRDVGGGSRAFGFLADRLTVDVAEAALIREAAERVLAGATLRAVVADWNARGVATVTGRPWTTTVLRRLLTSGRVCGWREHHGSFVTEAVWPAILDRATVERLRGLLLDPARYVAGNPQRYLLTGLLVCGICEEKLVARPRQDRQRCHVCASGPGFSGCGKIRVLAEPLEAWVVDKVLDRLDSPAFAALATRDDGPDEKALMTEIEGCEAKLADLAGQWATDQVSRVEWMAARKVIEGRLSSARRQLVTTGPSPAAKLAGQGGGLRSTWDELGFDRQRAVVSSVIDTVSIASAVRGLNRFDPRRVSVRWAG